MSAGDEKTLQLSFPDDYHNEELKGAAVEFKVTLNNVQEMVPRALWMKSCSPSTAWKRVAEDSSAAKCARTWRAN